jgi:hypothetical protein
MVKTKEDLVGRKVGRLIVIKQVDDYIGSNGSIMISGCVSVLVKIII